MVHPGCHRGDGDPRAATIRDGPGRPRRRDRRHDDARRARAEVRGGATKTKTKSSASKAKKMDPTGTPVVAKLLRPATALQAKYEAIAAEDPMRGLLIQVGGTMVVTMKLISRVLKKSGDKQAALVGRMLYVAYLALHQLILNYVESRIEILDGSPH